MMPLGLTNFTCWPTSRDTTDTPQIEYGVCRIADDTVIMRLVPLAIEMYTSRS